MFKKVDVVLWVEHKDRELASYEEIAKILKEKYNLSTIIISNFFHSYYLFLYRPKLVIWNNLTNNRGWPDGFMWEVYGDSLVYVSHRWEQMITPIGEKFKAPYDDFEKQKVKFFVWNRWFKDYLVSHNVKKENVFITGKISNNLLYNLKSKQQEFREKFSKEFNLDINKKWLFFPMNYSWIYRDDKKIEHMISRGYDKDIAYKLRDYSLKSFEKFKEFLKSVDKSKYEIILRPHPSITENDCQNKLTFKVKIIKHYSVREWIIASDIIITSWSTTIYDSYHIEKLSFRFLPYELPKWFVNKSLEVVPVIKNIKELEEKLDRYIFEETSLDENALQTFAHKVFELQQNKNSTPNYFKSIKYIKNFIKYFVKDKLCKYFNCFKIPKWQHYDWFEAKEKDV